MDAVQKSILVDANQAAALLGMSRSSFLRLDQRGLLGPRSVRLGRLVRWHRQQLEAWAAAGCPPRVRWMRMNGDAYGERPDSAKSGISRATGRVTGGLKIRRRA